MIVDCYSCKKGLIHVRKKILVAVVISKDMIHPLIIWIFYAHIVGGECPSTAFESYEGRYV